MRAYSYHFNCYLPDRQQKVLATLAVRTEASVTDLVRRMIDYCSQDRCLNEMFPAASGRLSVGEKRMVG